MKVLLFWSYYEYYLESLYVTDINTANLPYEKQLELILSDRFGWPPSVVNRLSEYGCEVKVLIVNALPLQKAWATENSCAFDEQTWKYDIPFQQVKDFNPDIIWIGTMLPYFGEYLKRLRTYCKKIFAWIAASVPSNIDLSSIDCVLTSHDNFREYFRSGGINCEILLPAFEPKILDSLPKSSRDIECSFIGSLSHLHMHRMEVMRVLAENTSIQIWGGFPKIVSRGILNPKFIYNYIKISKYKSRINSSVWGIEMYKTLAKSQLTINIHVDAASGLSGNMRMFEATGSGALLLTENSPNIKELYEPDSEVITYKNTPELVDKINYYISHPEKREVIANAGQQRTINSHSTMHRAKELLEIFNRYLKT